MSRYTEKGKYSRLGSIYHNMKTRCTNPNYDKYQYYGGKGISVCDDWFNSYEAFEEWAINNGYRDNLTLERIDINGNYCPSNCIWATRKEQANNRSSNHYLTYNGKTQTIQEWSEQTGITYNTISRRIKNGWSVKRTLTTPVDDRFRAVMITHNGKTQSCRQWSHELGLSNNAVRNRIMRGWTTEQAVTLPAGGHPI